ncbi:uncharacterized protein TM35_000232180 [Trypanosoma theileri]|uniref:Uncharacterized protein n=1 Tax=Trypanosoma theileri TaxID=67003 RepID=A0A1X0NRC8_9TRYP|nr:uncharacterized protein TM35_000232180 [Trypanosoma theileri]ORC87247.1 hypothetical protein TM35_000232180 [Trypanosoma theileri]
MFAFDFSIPSSEAEDYYVDFGDQFYKGSIPDKKDNSGTVSNTHSTDQHSHKDDHQINFIADDFSYGGYCYGGAMEGDDERFVSSLNVQDGVNFKYTMQDYPVFDYNAPQTSGKTVPLTSSPLLNKGSHDYGYSAPLLGLLDNWNDKESGFGYGLDALIHCVQFGFGPQPSFLVAAPSFFQEIRSKSQDVYYDLDGIENATISTETYSTKNNTSNARGGGGGGGGSSGGTRKKSDNIFGDAVKGRTNLAPFGFPERRRSSGEGSTREQYADKREAFAREARGYMQEMGFILSQLFEENDNSVNYGGKNMNSSTTRKMDAANLEAVLTGESTSHIKPQLSLPSSASPKRKKSDSVNLKNEAITQGKKTSLTTTSSKPQENKKASPTGENKKNIDMEYPVFDVDTLRESLMWPKFTVKPSRGGSSTKRVSERNTALSGRLEGPEISEVSPTTQQEKRHYFDDIIDSMEYPSIEGLRGNAMFLSSDDLPLFPQLARTVTGKELSKFTGPPTMTPEAEQDFYNRLEKDLREQEQRIVEARKRANDKAERRVSRMVVIDKRYAKKADACEKSDTNQIKKLQEQQKENEERRARVQAFLEKRRAKVSSMEKEVKKEIIPPELKHTEVCTSSVEEVRASNATSGRRIFHERRKSSTKPLVHVAVPYLDEQQLEERYINDTLIEPEVPSRREDNIDSKLHVSSLVIVQKSTEEQRNRRVNIALQSDKIIEIRQSHEMPRYFEVDEYLESCDDKNLYSVTLLGLKRKFLSGFNVAMFLAGSESALLLSWRAVREVMEGVFRDLDKDSELFLSVALVREGLTQDLLSESGRMVRTTFNFSALLDVTLDNVSYTKLQDLKHFSKLLAHAWELARLNQTHHSGFIAVSIVLKQIKENDLILSSMLVTSGNCSVDYLNGVLRKDGREVNRLFNGALGGSYFTVAVLALDEEDEGVVQLMNTQRKLASIKNRPGIQGSAKRYIERAEEELASCKRNDKAKLLKCKYLQEQVLMLKRALFDPKKYVPGEDVNELSKRHSTQKTNVKNDGCKESSSKDPNAPLLSKKIAVMDTVQEHKQGKKQQPQPLQQPLQLQTPPQHLQRQKPSSGNSLISQDTPLKKPINQPPSRLSPMIIQEKLKLPPPMEKPHPTSKSPVQVSQNGLPPKTVNGSKDKCVLPTLASVSTSLNKMIVPSTNAHKNIHPPPPPPQATTTTTSQGGLDALALEPVKRREGRRHQISSTSHPGGKEPTMVKNSSNAAISSQRIPCEPVRVPIPLKLPPCRELSRIKSENSLMSHQNSTLQRRLLEGGVTRDVPLNLCRNSSTPLIRSLSVSATVGATASTRYINRTEVPLQKPMFRDLEALSKGSEMTLSGSISPEMCPSTSHFSRAKGMGENAVRTPLTEQEEYVEEECDEYEERGERNVNGKGNNGNIHHHHLVNSGEENEQSSGRKYAPSTDSSIPSLSKVRTLVMVDSGCNESANVTHDETTVIVMTDDDFEEYEVDEVVERSDDSEGVQSKVLNELRDTFLLGCNAAILAADSRSSALSTIALKSVVREVLEGITEKSDSPHPKCRGTLSISIVQLNGETVLDLLKENSTAQKLVIAISPIFGPCVHNVTRLRVDSAVLFDSMLTSSLTRAAEKGREYGVVFVSIVLKQKQQGLKDVLISSLVTCFVGENVGLYAAVLDRSPLVPRPLFHYALGGPCYTVALLGFSGAETRANRMLAVQKRLGEVLNRPTHPGSINKFISGIHNDLEPSLRKKLQEQDGDEAESTRIILKRLGEMARDAETLLKDFWNSEPKAYLNETEPSKIRDSRSQRKPPLVTSTNANDGEKVRSLVCCEQRLLGNGSIAVQGNAVLTRLGEYVCRYDVDEVVERESGSNSLPSQLIDDLVLKFLSGQNTALLSADSRSSAVTPLILRKIAYLILYNLTMDSESAPANAELLASIALVKDDVTVDLLAEDEDNIFHRFEVETTPIYGRRLRGVSYHIVNTAEKFDHLLAFAVDRAAPALRSEDPGIMVISLILTQYFEKPESDVLVSSFMATTVFDNVSHYAGVLQNDPNEPTDLFKNALGGPCFTVAMLGLCDEDEDVGKLLSIQMELAHIRNRPSPLVTVKQHIRDLKKGITMLRNHAESTEDEQQKNYIREKIAQAEGYLREAVETLEVPVREKGFVPLGSQM